MKLLAPIVLFTYNRLEHTKQTVEALAKNVRAEDSDLYIFSDGAKSVDQTVVIQEVRDYLATVKGFKTVNLVFSEINKGLATSIIEGVSQVLKHHDAVIVLEDDLQTSPYFLQYMNDALNFYQPETVWSVAGYSPNINIPDSYEYQTYLAHRNCSWGWATWKQNWMKTDWNVKDFNAFFVNEESRRLFNRGGNDLSIMLLKQQQQIIDSWSIRFNYSAFNNDLATVYPTKSLVKNLGVDGSGTNMKSSDKYHTILNIKCIPTNTFCPKEYILSEIQYEFRQFYNTSLFRSCINYLKMMRYVKSINSK